jgi:hypothetical protein
VQRPFCSPPDLGSEGAPASTAPAVFLTVLAADRLCRRRPVERGAQNGPEPGRLETSTDYRAVRRYSAGVFPVARRNARVKLDCEENRQSRAISKSDARPAAIIALALSSRRRLT